jgi:ketopantoate hydroxymethyltransferase
VTAPDAWIANQTDAQLTQMALEMLHHVGTTKEHIRTHPDDAAATMRLGNCETVLEMVLREQAKRLAERVSHV